LINPKIGSKINIKINLDQQPRPCD
jgi:hypothetical protein